MNAPNHNVVDHAVNRKMNVGDNPYLQILVSGNNK